MISNFSYILTPKIYMSWRGIISLISSFNESNGRSWSGFNEFTYILVTMLQKFSSQIIR